MMTSKLAWMLVIAGLLLMSTGCAHPLGAAVATANAAAEGLRASHKSLAAKYRADQVAAVERVQGDPSDPSVVAEKKDRVERVRRRYDHAWEAYKLARTAWVAAVGAIETAEQAMTAGGMPPLEQVQRVLFQLAILQRELFVEADRVGLSPPNAPPREP